MEPRTWAVETAPNPAVVRLHVGHSLTEETIVTCPPATPPAPLERLFEIEAIRSLDLHPYRARLNLRPGAPADDAVGHAAEVLEVAWGPPATLSPDAGPRAFVAAVHGPRVVAESPAMAEGHAMLAAVFEVHGVAEVVVGDGIVLVRLGRLFDWDANEAAVADAVQTAGGMPGSTSSSS